MKNFLSGAFRVLFGLLQSILRPIGKIGMCITGLFLIILVPCYAFEGASDPIEKKLILRGFVITVISYTKPHRTAKRICWMMVTTISKSARTAKP